MDNEVKRLFIEIVTLVVVMMISIPVCISASSRYGEKRNQFSKGNHAIVSIAPQENNKKITVTSDYKDAILVYLMMKISKFDNDYLLYFENRVYDMKTLKYTEDSDYRYYNLGLYEVDKMSSFDFDIRLKGKSYYDENISYSFYTEGLL